MGRIRTREERGDLKVENASLLSEDFAPGQLPQGPEGQRGPQGEPGVQGEPGIQGERGPAGATNLTIRQQAIPVTGSAAINGSVNCNPGERATGGGVQAGGNDFVWQSRPFPPADPTPNGWGGGVADPGAGVADGGGIVFVVCASP